MKALSEFELITDLLCSVTGPSMRGILEQLLARKVNRDLASRTRSYEELFFGVVDVIREYGHINSAAYDRLADLHVAIATEIEQRSRVDASTFDPRVFEGLRALSLLGGLTHDPHSETVSVFLAPSMLPRAVTLASQMDSATRQKHILEIAKVRGVSLGMSARDADRDWVAPFCSQLQQTIKGLARKALPTQLNTRALDAFSVEYLPTSSGFYNAGISYYRNPKARSHSHFIFSTTSGLVLPDEFHGAAFYRDVLPIKQLYRRTEKNPWRRQYFESLMNISPRSGKPRMYYFDHERTSAHFQRQAEAITRYDGEEGAAKYRRLVEESISGVLHQRGFGLAAIRRFPDILEHLTLGNGVDAILSLRVGGHRSIGQAFWLRPAGTNWQALSALDWKEVIGGVLGSAGAAAITGELLGSLPAVVAAGFLSPITLFTLRYAGRPEARRILADILDHADHQLRQVDMRVFKYPDEDALEDPEHLAHELLLSLGRN
jgi:hypothetical protein